MIIKATGSIKLRQESVKEYVSSEVVCMIILPAIAVVSVVNI